MTNPPPSAFDWSKASLTHRDCLPHVRQENVIYFITFRLADSLPAARTAELRKERDRWLLQNPPPHTAAQNHQYRQIWTVHIENLMDAGHGACILREPRSRDVIESLVRHHDSVAYRLGDFVIMPNHVHALLQPLPGWPLSRILQAWKSASTRKINLLLGRRGPLWQEEYFDHALRDLASLSKFTHYIQSNPARLTPNTFTVGHGSLAVK